MDIFFPHISLIIFCRALTSSGKSKTPPILLLWFTSSLDVLVNWDRCNGFENLNLSLIPCFLSSALKNKLQHYAAAVQGQFCSALNSNLV